MVVTGGYRNKSTYVKVFWSLDMGDWRNLSQDMGAVPSNMGRNPAQAPLIYGLNEFSQTRANGLGPIPVQKCGRKRSQ